MTSPRGLLGQVAKAKAETRSAANVGDTFLDSTIATGFMDRYVPIRGYPARFVWEGSLLAPRDGFYRFGFAFCALRVTRSLRSTHCSSSHAMRSPSPAGI